MPLARAQQTDIVSNNTYNLLNSNVNLQVFNLSDLDINFSKMSAAFAPEFAALPWDFYDQRMARFRYLKKKFPADRILLDSYLEEIFYDKISAQELHFFLDRLSPAEVDEYEALLPFRRRSVAQFHMAKGELPDVWHSERRPLFRFAQKPDQPGDYRAFKREFAPMADSATENADFQKLLSAVATRSEEASDIKRPRAFFITAHMVSLECDASRTTTNSPEGIHQDGADFIVSALIMRRENVKGAVSMVYGADKNKTILEHTLQESEGIFQSDMNSPLWHQVSPINILDPKRKGYRDTLGFDIQIL